MSTDSRPHRKCDCCGFNTMSADIGEYDICPVCFWQDDGSGFLDVDEPSSANMGITLGRARENYRMFGAFHRSHVDNVRPPKDHEK